MLLVIAHSRAARTSLRNVCRAHEGTVVRQLGRVALLAETEFGAFQALRLREKHGEEIQLERTQAFNEFASVPEGVREAARRYESRDEPAVPYESFAADRALPPPSGMKERQL